MDFAWKRLLAVVEILFQVDSPRAPRSSSRVEPGRAPGTGGASLPLRPQLLALVGLLAALAACSDRPAPASPGLSPLAALGEQIFNDPSLSASGRQACASCHDEAHAFSPPNGLPVQPGGVDLELAGTRRSPSIRYVAQSGAFRFAADGTPTGGFFWDGRARSLSDQAGQPFLNPLEMANTSRGEVVARLAAASYADQFRAIFGPDAFDEVDGAYQRMTVAIQQYELEDPAFAPFTSKFDAFLRGEAQLTDREARGLALYNSPTKGNCAACHPSARGADGSHPLFTDFTYDVLGVPRNPAIPANADPAFFDLGLCARPDLAGRSDLCGAFKVPSLRNVASRQALFHNGRFTTLTDALHFYVLRDIDPARFYPVDPDGTVRKFDDLPPAHWRNVNTTEVPYNRRPGDQPALDDDEIEDVVTFLQTLDDGWQP